MQHSFLASSASSPSSPTAKRGQNSLGGGDQWWLTESPSGSRPSSVVTEPYLSNSFLSPTALSTATRSLCDGDVLDSSPIAASRLYRPSSSREAVAAFCLHSSPGDVIDGPLEIPLYAGLSSIGGTIGHRGTAAEDQRVCLPIAQAIDAVLEIDDGLHVLCDQGSVDGMYLGHRRARMKQGAGYVMSDGKLVWFGRFAFWYRVLDDTRRSASPPPPWRDTAGMRLFPSSEGKALAAADTMHSEPHAAPRSIVRESPAVAARPAMLSREARASRPRAARLQREVAAAAISQSPGLRLQRLPVLGSPPPSGPLSLLAHGSPGSDARSFLGSPPQGTDHGFALSPMLVNSPAYGSDGEESLPTGTEPMSEEDGDDEPPRHMLSSPPPLHLLTYPASPSPPRIHLGSAHSVLRLEGLRMGGGDVLASESDDDDDGRRSVLSRAQTEVLTASSCRSPEPEAVGVEAPPTQPVSPSRLPPQRLLTSGSRSSSVNDALLGKKHCAAAEQNTGGTQVTKAPVSSGEPDATLAYLPQPSALVCAPSRVILVGNGASPSYTEHQQMIPRYPYDVKGMESFLRSATQNTSPTQPDIESIDCLDASHLSVISVETMQSSDFSQAFISPQPPPRPSAAIPCAVETRSSSRMSVDSADTSSLRNNCPALTTAQSSSVSSAMAPISTPTTRRLATYSKRHRRSIDNYTDEEEDDEQNEEEGEKDEEAPVVVSETPAKRTSNKLGSRSGSRLSTPSTSALSLASSSAAAGSRSSHRFSTPTSMSSRLKLPRHTPLNLKPSAHILHAPPPPPPPPPLRMDAMLSRTPMSRGSHGRSPATTQSSNYPNLPPTAPLTASARSAGFDVSRLSIGRTPMGTSNDGFPDDDMIPGSLLGTQSVNRANRSHRRYTQGSGMPPAPVNQAHSPLIYPHTTSAVAPVQTYRPVMTGVLESPMSIDSPTAAYTRPPAPSERIIGDTVAMGDEDGLALSSSPSLPHPSMLLQSPSTAVNADSETQEKTNASKEPVEHRSDLVPTRSGAEEEALFDPLVDPLSSAPTASAKSTTGSPVTDDRDPFAEPVDIDDTQLDHEDSIVPEKPPPRIHLRVPTKSTASLVSCSSAAAAVAASATDVLAEDSPTVAQQAASTGDGWINMDDVQIAADVPSKPARATTAVRHGRGAGRTRGRGAIKSDNDQPIAPRTPSATTISPAGSRSNTLLDSLRKLPGKQGSKRTGLSTSRRTPVSAKKTLPAPVVAKGTQSASGSPTPKALGIPVRASTATGTVAVAPKLQPVAINAAGGATLLQPERVDTKPGARVTGGKQRGGRRLSHRNLDLAQTTPTKAHHPSLPPTRKGIDRTPAAGASPASAMRLTRQSSSSTCSDGSGIRLVVISGFVDEALDRIVRQLETHGLSVTANPLIADICVRQGKLGRTLKVLCALARGVPVVSPNWVSDLGSVALRTRSTSTHKTLAGLAQTHLLIDRATEREWEFTLTDTLRKAREANGSGQKGLLAGYCVYVEANVARSDPVCLSVMVKSAGGFVLNDFGRGEERLLRGEEPAHAEPHLSRRSASATTAPDLLAEGTPTAADCVLADELTESSTEPDNDSDEDWSASNNQARGRRTSSSGTGVAAAAASADNSCRKRRKTLPKLPKIEYESSEDGGGGASDAVGRAKLKSEPSMIFAPPPPGLGSAATTPVRYRGSSESPSVRQQPPLSSSSASSKRRRIQESPSISATATHFGGDAASATAGLGSSVFFDPHCSCQDMAIMLAARKDELGIPADARLLVVLADTEQALQKKWMIHGALVVEPELIIQSIIHCARRF